MRVNCFEHDISVINIVIMKVCKCVFNFTASVSTNCLSSHRIYSRLIRPLYWLLWMNIWREVMNWLEEKFPQWASASDSIPGWQDISENTPSSNFFRNIILVRFSLQRSVLWYSRLARLWEESEPVMKFIVSYSNVFYVGRCIFSILLLLEELLIVLDTISMLWMIN